MTTLRVPSRSSIPSRACIVAAIALLGACSASQPHEGSTTATTDHASNCVLPIADYCRTHPCPSFDTAAAQAREALQRGTVRSLQTGTCGPYRYLAVQEGMGSSTDYYDAQGALVGTYGMADSTMHCGGTSMSVVYGVEPHCTQQPDPPVADGGT